MTSIIIYNLKVVMLSEEIVERGFITTTEATTLLGVKQRRARNILGKMVENKWLRKEGASRSTIYVIDAEKR